MEGFAGRAPLRTIPYQRKIPLRLGLEVAVQTRLGRWLLGGVLACSVAAIGMVAANLQSPARSALVLVFVILAPSIAIGYLLRDFDPLARAVLAVSSSLVLLTLTAMIMLVGGFWSPTGGLLAIASLTAVCVMAQWPPIARRLSAATDALGRYGQRRLVPDWPLADPAGPPIEPNRGS